MNGLEKAQEAVNKIKGVAVEETKIAREEYVEKALETIEAGSDLAKMYNEARDMGAKNLGGSLPMLKIHTTNKSLGNELATGGEPKDGWFFYTATQEQFENPVCHILTISKGFRAEGMVDNKTGLKGELKFNQILGGLINDNGNYKPFLMYFAGKRLNNLWDFGKEASKYTHAKPLSIPLFALSVKFSTEKVKTDYGPVSVVKFDIVKNDKGFPVVIMDSGKFVFVRDMVESMEEQIAGLIATKYTEESVQVTKGVEVDSAGNKIEDVNF